MSTRMLAESWKDIAAQFLKIGATAYGGPAIMGIMQSELQEKRRWVSKERFVEGLSLVNMLPGATAAQLSIFLGYARGGWWGGLLGGLCFVLPGFVVLLALTIGYATLGVSPILRGALYGLGPVVLGVYLVAVYRLAMVALSTRSQVAIAIAAAAATFGVLAVSLVRLAPHALPDVLAGATLIATVVVLMVWRVATLKVMLVGAVLGVVRSRLVSLPGARAVLSAVMRA